MFDTLLFKHAAYVFVRKKEKGKAMKQDFKSNNTGNDVEIIL